MGCFDVMCSLCGLPLNTSIENLPNKSAQWLYKCTLLLNNNTNVNGATEINCNTTFKKNGKIYSTNNPNYKMFIVIHDECYKYVEKNSGMKLKYSDFPQIKEMIYGEYDYFLYKVNYHFNKLCWQQDFNFTLYNKSLDKPKKGNDIGKRIGSVLSQLKIRGGRTGPNVSASYYKSGNMLIGNDGNIWKIQNGKWIKTKTEKKTIIMEVKKNGIEDIINWMNYRITYDKYPLYELPNKGLINNGYCIDNIQIVKSNSEKYKITVNLLVSDMIISKIDNILKNELKLK